MKFFDNLSCSNWCMPISPDWCMVIVTALSAGVTWYALVCKPKKDETKDRISKLHAAFAALEKTRRTLLLFKQQFIAPRAGNAIEFAQCISNVDMCNDHKRISEDDLKIINKGIEDLDLITQDAEIERLYNKYRLLANSQRMERHNMVYPENAIIVKDLSEKLYFIASYNPGMLIGLQQIVEEMEQLNSMIRTWNDHVHENRQKAITRKSHEKMNYMRNYLSFSFDFFWSIEGTLMCIKISMDHLKEYADKYYQNDFKNFDIYGKYFDLEEFIPERDENAKKIKENLDAMKIQ